MAPLFVERRLRNPAGSVVELDAAQRSGEAASRRGEVTAFAGADTGLQPGQVFLPFCYREAAANLLTNEALDPAAKIPEFKFCAVRVEATEATR